MVESAYALAGSVLLLLLVVWLTGYRRVRKDESNEHD